MKTHTNNFKQEIKKFGREISGKIFYYPNYNLTTENDEIILTENEIELMTEQIDENNVIEIDSELIYSMKIIQDGDLLQSLMKEFDFEAKQEFNIGSIINPKFGLLVNNDYEYLDYGNYIIYSKEYNLDKETWSYTCYDMMLYSMIKYKPIPSALYPMTIRDFIGMIANDIGLEFANKDDVFINYNQIINEELFADKGYTFRDILDKLSQITASNILINKDNKLEICYVNDTQDTINEDYLKDVNVAFGQIFGPINKILISNTENKTEYSAEDSSSIERNQKTQINITDNEFTFNGQEQIMCQAILRQLNGLYYSINDFSTTGICYYDYLDLFEVEAKGNNYQCLLLNNEMTFKQGIEEKIFTNEMENIEKTTNDYKTSVMSNKIVTYKINQQDKRIEESVQQDNIIASLNLAIEDGQGVINLKGNQVTIESDNFELDEEGNVKMSSAEINHGKLKLYDNGSGIQTVWPELSIESGPEGWPADMMEEPAVADALMKIWSNLINIQSKYFDRGYCSFGLRDGYPYMYLVFENFRLNASPTEITIRNDSTGATTQILAGSITLIDGNGNRKTITPTS